MAIEEAKDAKARAEELVTSLEAKVALATAAAEAIAETQALKEAQVEVEAGGGVGFEGGGDGSGDDDEVEIGADVSLMNGRIAILVSLRAERLAWRGRVLTHAMSYRNPRPHPSLLAPHPTLTLPNTNSFPPLR